MLKPFAFSLDRIRDYRVQVLDTEKNTLMGLYKRLYDIEDRIEICRSFRQEKQGEMQAKQLRGLTMRELEECKFYLENMRRQLEDLEEDRIQASMEVERQRLIVVKCSQDVSSLDKLEEKQLEDYHYMEARDSEKDIMEQVIHSLTYPRLGLT
jgi:flagellar FliJ protein